MTFLKDNLSQHCDIVIIFFIILITILSISIVDTISSRSVFISQMTGPAIGGVIAVFAGYIFTSWRENEKQNKRKKFLANVFLNELRKINLFIAGIDAKNIKSDDFLITHPPIISGGILQKDPRPEYDEGKRRDLLYYFSTNKFIRISDGAPLITNKNPFELFAPEIYSFEDNDLIIDLFSIATLLNDANTSLLKFFQIWEQSDGHLELFIFMTKIQKVKPILEKILSDGNLENGKVMVKEKCEEPQKGSTNSSGVLKQPEGRILMMIDLIKKTLISWIRLDYIELLAFIIVFVTFIWIFLAVFTANIDISMILIQGNLTTSDKNVGQGLQSIINPFLGILFGTILFLVTQIINAFKGIGANEKTSEKNKKYDTIIEKLNDIDGRLQKIENKRSE